MEIRYHNHGDLEKVEEMLGVTDEKIRAICTLCFKLFPGRRDRGTELVHEAYCRNNRGKDGFGFVKALELPVDDEHWVVECAKRGILGLLPGTPIVP